VALTYYRDFANNTVSTAQQISKSLSKQGIHKGSREMSLLREELETRRKEHHLSTLGIFLKGERNSIRTEDPMLTPVSLHLPEDLLEAGFSGKEVSRILSVGEGEMITGIAPIFNPSEGGGVIGIVVASHFIPKSLTTKMREISQAFVEYKQLKILK